MADMFSFVTRADTQFFGGYFDMIDFEVDDENGDQCRTQHFASGARSERERPENVRAEEMDVRLRS